MNALVWNESGLGFPQCVTGAGPSLPIARGNVGRVLWSHQLRVVDLSHAFLHF